MISDALSKGKTARSFGGLRMTAGEWFFDKKIMTNDHNIVILYLQTYPPGCHPEASEGPGCFRLAYINHIMPYERPGCL
jgi:hypothetical protein